MQQQPPVRKLSAQKKSGPGVTQWPAHGVLRHGGVQAAALTLTPVKTLQRRADAGGLY
jgi:hypothetical protein